MRELSAGRYLSIVKLSRHHSVVGRSLIHRSEPLTSHLAPCHDIHYSRCLPEPSGASNPRTHLAVYTCGSGLLVGVLAS